MSARVTVPARRDPIRRALGRSLDRKKMVYLTQRYGGAIVWGMELTKLATRLTRIESLVEHQLRDELGVSLLDCQIKPEPNPDSDEYTFFFTLEGESPGSTVRLGGDVPMKMLVSETDGAIAQRLYSALRASYRKILAG